MSKIYQVTGIGLNEKNLQLQETIFIMPMAISEYAAPWKKAFRQISTPCGACILTAFMILHL